jgi:hypothetical protein
VEHIKDRVFGHAHFEILQDYTNDPSLFKGSVIVDHMLVYRRLSFVIAREREREKRLSVKVKVIRSF